MPSVFQNKIKTILEKIEKCRPHFTRVSDNAFLGAQGASGREGQIRVQRSCQDPQPPD